MRRLLWKEWHEIRWYLVGLLLGPWLLSLRTSTHLLDDRNYVLDSGSMPVMVLLLVIAFWGATRLSGENRPGRLSMRTLPVSRWKVFVVKLLPGLIVAGLMPLWIHLVFITRYHPDFSNWGYPPAHYIFENLWGMLCAYLVSFALSTCTSTAVAVIAGFGILMLGSRFMTSFCDLDIGRAFFSMMALFAAPMLWIKGGTGGAKRKIAIGAISILLTIPIFLGLFYVYFIGHWRGPTPGMVLFLETITGRYHFSPTIPELTDWDKPVVSADRRLLAYSSQSSAHFGRKKTIPIVLDVWDFRLRKSLLTEDDAAPIVWLANGSLLFLKYGESRADLIEWNPSTRKGRYLLSYTCNAGKCPIEKVIPSPDGRWIAFFILPRHNAGVDMWMLDRQSTCFKLIRPGVEDYDYSPTWDGDRLIYSENWDFWSIKPDGSDRREIKLGGPLCADF